ncbi:ATP-binding protein [Consotaella aegiceratis]|uniref:ATP-binding protein n=1 Tax=Consotaella aegiceratis TaxID=3097961 RepID=UPI002F40A2BA
MHRLLPRSLGGQLAVLLICGLLAAHLVSAYVFSGERDRAVAATVRYDVVERIAALVEIIDGTTPETAARLAGALSNRRTRFSIDPDSALPSGAMGTVETGFARQLASILSLGPNLLRVRVEEAEPDGDALRRSGPKRQDGHHWREWRSLTNIAVSVPLQDGRWLNATASLRAPSPEWSWSWIFTLAVSALVILTIVALVVGRITRPIRALATAAEKVGRGETVEPIPPRGPAEIRTTVEAFNAMEERLTRFVRDRTRMVAAISHDLRTPVTSLRIRAEFIDDDELKTDVIRILDELQAMAEATLAFVRDESSGEETRTVDLAALIEGIVEDQQTLGRDASYRGPERLPWRCRPVSLKRAITNLVENAIRYAGSVCIDLSDDGGEARIVVEDDGPGIPEAQLDDVFEPFVRLEASRNRSTGGVGLGLSIARSIARAHGGDLKLANRRDGGLAATLSLP